MFRIRVMVSITVNSVTIKTKYRICILVNSFCMKRSKLACAAQFWAKSLLGCRWKIVPVMYVSPSRTENNTERATRLWNHVQDNAVIAKRTRAWGHTR